MPHSSWMGRTLGGRYTIEELLGQGGMSSVYRATDPNLGRAVAIKLIHPHLSSAPEFVSRFDREAKAVAQLRHPHIIAVYDFAKDDDIYYMVLEYVPGETLQKRLKDLTASSRRLPMTDAIGIAASLCEAVDYAHQKDIIHRDIKPANVMLNVQGQAILMDFGIAKIVGGQHHTATGATIGTALYMSPEQIRGEATDHRADIYSLGVTLYEMVSGRPPFEADSAMSVMMKHLNDPVPDLSQLNREVPADLVTVINQALAKDRAHRFQSAGAMAAALRRIRPGRSIASPVATTIDEQPTRGTIMDAAPRGPAGPIPPLSPPPSVSSRPPAAPRSGSRVPLALAGGGVVGLVGLVCLAGIALLGYNQLFPATVAEPTPTATSAPTETETATAVPGVTGTVGPTPTETPIPTGTVPPGLYSRINGIQITSGYYVVDYETFEYSERLPGMHVHFFFNTVPPAQAGVPGQGPWILYGGPRPFTGYAVSDKPAGATQMCILVSNPNHSVHPNSGNCVDLPVG